MSHNIGMFSLKGGVGKTSIGLNLAITLGYAMITNDVHVPLEDILPEGDFLKINPGEKFPDGFDHVDIVYDFGGYIDLRTIDVIKRLDVVIVPIQVPHISLQVGINSINELQAYNKRIVVIANGTHNGDFKTIETEVRKFFNVPVFELKSSKFFDNIFREKRSLREVVAGGGLKRYNYQKLCDQFDIIIEHLGLGA